MKGLKTVLSIVSAIVILTLTGCTINVYNDDSRNNIDFPRVGVLGYQNILTGNITKLEEDQNYSLAVDVKSDEVVRIVFKNKSVAEEKADTLGERIYPYTARSLWYFRLNSRIGWGVNSYNDSTGYQTFACKGPIYADLNMFFLRNKTKKGSAEVEIYIGENPVEPERTLNLKW
jgi:hypothetical protein